MGQVNLFREEDFPPLEGLRDSVCDDEVVLSRPVDGPEVSVVSTGPPSSVVGVEDVVDVELVVPPPPHLPMSPSPPAAVAVDVGAGVVPDAAGLDAVPVPVVPAVRL